MPEGGPYLDQDAGLMQRMAVLANIHGAVEHLRSLYGKEIHSLSPAERRILGWLKELELL